MQIKRRTFLLGAAATLAMKENGAAQVAASSDNTQLVTWSRVVTNGGGLINGLSIASDGTKTCRTDTGGWYVWDRVNSIWVQSATVAKTDSPPYEFSGYRGLAGIPECQVAPSNGNYIYWGAGRTDEPTNGFTLVATEIVHDHDVSGTKRRDQIRSALFERNT